MLLSNTIPMKNKLSASVKTLTNNYIRCGILGWCLEILFTSLSKGPGKNPALMGKTSILMFPIYGAACLFKPIYPLIKKLAWPVRGFLYMNMIYLTELISGLFLTKHNCCPWDYSDAKYQYKKVIRLDFAPYWFCTGLLYEKFLQKSNLKQKA